MPICFFSFFSCTCTYDREAIDNLTWHNQSSDHIMTVTNLTICLHCCNHKCLLQQIEKPWTGLEKTGKTGSSLQGNFVIWRGKKEIRKGNPPSLEGNLPCCREILPSLQGIKHFSRLGHGHPSQKTRQQLVMIECIFKSSRVNVGIIVTLFCHVTDVSLYSPEEGTSQWNCFLLWTW